MEDTVKLLTTRADILDMCYSKERLFKDSKRIRWWWILSNPFKDYTIMHAVIQSSFFFLVFSYS